VTISEVLAIRFIRPSGVDAVTPVSVSEILSGYSSVMSYDILADVAGDFTIDLTPLPGGNASFIYAEGDPNVVNGGVQVKIAGDVNTPYVMHTLYEFETGNAIGALVVNTGVNNMRFRVIVAK
jgi:hypothetical protein